MDVIAEIERWEREHLSGFVPGSRIERVLHPDPKGGFEWAVSLGALMRLRWIGRGRTVEEAFLQAVEMFDKEQRS